MNSYFNDSFSDNSNLQIRVKGVLFQDTTPFQKIEIVDSYDFGRMLVLDGIINMTEKDEFVYHEMMTHVPLLSHPNPRGVLVIGGGDGGTVREVLKHPDIERVDLVEIDRAVVKACKQFFPAISSGFGDPRVTVHFEDGTRFVPQHRNTYDVVILDATDPVGPGQGLYRESFYVDCLNSLIEDGNLVAHSGSVFFDPDIVTSVSSRLRKVFPLVKIFITSMPSYASGIWSFVFCSKKYDPIDDFQKKRYQQSNLTTRYYNADIHRASFALPSFMRAQFDL
jgi:spermidine synthase